MQDDVHLRHDTAATLDEFDCAGHRRREVQPLLGRGRSPRPAQAAGFDAADPAGYPWGNYDTIVQAISNRGCVPT